MIVELSLGECGVLPERLRERIVGKAPDFTGPRKRAFLDALLIVLGGESGGRLGWDRAAFALEGLHAWAAVQVTAVKVVLAVAGDRRDLIEPADVERLTATQTGAGVWEGNVLIHLWVLHALCPLQGTEGLVEAGIARVLEHQRADGGLPFVTDVDTWCTATGGIALAAARAPARLHRKIAGHLIRMQRPDGGWSFTDEAVVTDVDDTAVSLQYLQVCGQALPAGVVESGWRALESLRCSDGGYPTYVREAPPEASMTAAALDALTPQPHLHASTIRSGLRFLAGQQREDGSFPPDWSSSRWHTVFRAVLACSRAGVAEEPEARRIVERAVELALSVQNADGGWGQQEGDPSDPLSTAYGLMTVCRRADSRPAAHAARYLLAVQHQDGTMPCVPDSIGPRPLVFTVPLLSDIFCLLAFAHFAENA